MRRMQVVIDSFVIIIENFDAPQWWFACHEGPGRGDPWIYPQIRGDRR